MLVALLLAAVSAGCSTRIGTSWPMLDTVEMGGRTRIVVGYNTIVALLDPSNGSVTQLEDSEGRVRNDENGNPRRWIIDGGSKEHAEFFGRPLRLDDDYLLFPSANNRLLKVDLKGALIDPPDAKGIPLSSPAIANLVASDIIIYASLKYGDVVALDRDTYTELWRASVPEGVWSAPVIQDGILYVSGINHFLYAYNAETGAPVWSVDLGGLVGASPLVTADAVYIGSFDHKMFKISKDGQILAAFEGNNWFWSTPVLADGVLYATDLGGSVYAINPTDMTAVWSLKVASRGIRPGPIVSGDYVVAASRDGSVYWLTRKTGELVKRRELDGRPEILSDMLLLEPSDSLDISEPLIVIGTVDTARLAIAFPLNPDSGYQGWIYSR